MLMKKKKELGIKINLTNRWLYTFIVIGILAIIGVGVYAYGTSAPATFGHSIGEINWQSGIISKLNVTNLCIGTDCKTGWPSAAGVCPTGMTAYYNYSNDGEDVYGTGTYTGSNAPTDTCNGDRYAGYTCVPSFSGTCSDTVGLNPSTGSCANNCNTRIVTCKQSMYVRCKEP
jgi:hypothetical protein